MIEFNVYDVIVLKDNNGSILQDTIYTITKEALGLNPLIIRTTLVTNMFTIYVVNEEITIIHNELGELSDMTIEEIWSRTKNNLMERKYYINDTESIEKKKKSKKIVESEL